MPIAIILGVNGQDGSYLSDILLEKDYTVVGITRRRSVGGLDNIQHVLGHPNFHLEVGDITDSGSLQRIVEKWQPDEFYNLAAQSFVGLSWKEPYHTSQVTGIGVLNCLEVLKQTKPDTKFYQASSSEMFGKVHESPQTETTKFHPRSPYGVAKLYGYWITRNYRESYGMFAANGILFNHETTVSKYTPMFYKDANETLFDIKPINEIVKFDESKNKYMQRLVSDLMVWDKSGWVDVTCASCYPHNITCDNKNIRMINARNGVYAATGSHVAIMSDDSEKETGDIEVGDKLSSCDFPISLALPGEEDEAELLGLLVGDGSITRSKSGIGISGKFTNSNERMRRRFDELWVKTTGGHTSYYPSKSGFTGEIVGQLRLVGGCDYLRKIYNDIYNQDKTKRVPKRILNSSEECKLAFLKGYNAADGLKANPCIYEFKNFKTNSPTLALGLLYLIDQTTGQDFNITVEQKEDGRLFFSINLLSPGHEINIGLIESLIDQGYSQRKISKISGHARATIRKVQSGAYVAQRHPLKLDNNEVKKIIELPNHDGWLYDLETSSGTFHAGVGRAHIHNSPRRGIEFVTRKITDAAVRIKLSGGGTLGLGNLDPRRDWGHSKDYMRAAHLMLQHDKPDDFVIATGKTHSIRDLLVETFEYVGLNWQDHVYTDERFVRPAEVDLLLGDATKAREELGWQPEYDFRALVREMVDSDDERIRNEQSAKTGLK